MAQNAVDMIKADHRKVEQLYQQFQQGQGSQKQHLAEQICQELTIHAQLEESIFYPAVQQKLGPQGSSLVQEALKEHDEMKQKIRQVQSGGNGSNVDGMVSQLMSAVKHHVQEEESQMLPQAQQQLGIQLDQLGMQMQQQKQQLVSAAGNQGQSSGGTTSRGTNPGTRSSSQSDKPMHG